MKIRDLNNMKVLITSGGTRVPIDDVRSIVNMSTGRFGAELAARFISKGVHGNDLTVFRAKGSFHPYTFLKDEDWEGVMPHYSDKEFNSYDEYLNVIDLAKEIQPDVIISVAAVSDYTLDKVEGKITAAQFSKDLVITLKNAKKVLPEFKTVCPRALVVGFKLLVSPAYEEVYYAVQKVLNNGADMVVYNDLTEIRKGNSKRLVFQPHNGFREAKDVSELVQIIENEHSARSDR